MNRTRFVQPVLAAAILTVAFALAGCGESRMMSRDSVLIDAAHPPKSMFHVTTVADPFDKADPNKVLKGGPLGPSEPTHANKLTLVTDKGLFTMPKSGVAELRFKLGVRKIQTVQIEMVAENPKADKKFNATLPAADSWQELAIKLDPAVFKPGCSVFDITIFQIGKDPAAEIYLGEIKLRTE